MSPQALLEEILRLPAPDRLRLMEEIWSSLTPTEDEVPVPAWHLRELAHRLADPAAPGALSWDEVRQRLRGG
jgi:putative addiction module component (TIGR02574 family)